MCTGMKRSGNPGLVVLAGAFTLIALASTQAMSAPGQEKACSDTTIRGNYGIQMQGTRPAGPGVIENVVGVVLRHYDGQGYFDQIDNIKGSVSGIALDRPGSGTYQVNADCTGTTSFQPDPNNPSLVIVEKIVIVDDGNEIRAIGVSPPPLMVSSVAKRVGKH